MLELDALTRKTTMVPQIKRCRIRRRSDAPARHALPGFVFFLVAVAAASSSAPGNIATGGGSTPNTPPDSRSPVLMLHPLQPILKNRWLRRLFLKRRTPLLRDSSWEQDVYGPSWEFSSPLNETATSSERGISLPRNEFTATSESIDTSTVSGGRPSQYHDTSTALASTLSALVKGLLSDRQRLARITASSIQVGLILYLAHAAWKAVTEVANVYSAELAVAGSGSEPQFVKPDLVAQILAACEELIETDPETDLISEAASDALGATTLSSPLWNVIRRLVASGLPLRSSPDRPTSVESVLLQLTKTEAAILHQCLWTPPPSAIKARGVSNLQNMWLDVAGLFPVKERLLGALASLRGRNHAQNAFRGLFEDAESITSSSNQGILLYGPPGCGKTLLVRALATTARLPCLTITPSSLLRKYVGETNRQVRNLFTLAQKLAPCILCIDELDGIFRERSDSEHEVSRDLKTEFLQWWDGMLSNPSTSSAEAKREPILVIGASNRPFDVDAAVLRRLSASYYVGLPDAATRAFFLRRLLEKIPSDVDLHRITMLTEGYSPSDLRQVLQSAAVMGPMKDFSLRRRSLEEAIDDDVKSKELERLRPRNLETRDVLMALANSPPTPMSLEYRRALKSFARLNLPHFSTPESSAGIRDDLDSTMLDTRWETSEGTFYHLGQLDVDPQTFDTLFDVMSHFSSQSEDITDSEDDETDPE